MKCSTRGRFTVTEVVSPHGAQPPRFTAITAEPSGQENAVAALSSIPEKGVKRGRFRVFTACLSCDSTATKYDDLDEVCQPFVTAQQQEQQCASPLAGLKLDTCNAFFTSSTTSVSTPVKAAPAALHGSAARDVPRRWRDQDAAFADGGRSSWESASSGLSSTLSMDSCRGAASGKPHVRRVRFSEPGNDVAVQPVVQMPTTPQAASTSVHDQQPQTRAVNFIALINSGSIAELPRSVTRCYQRGRFSVEEGVLSPCLSGSNVLAAAAAPPPVLHRSPSLPTCGSDAAAAAAIYQWRALSPVTDMDESPSTSESGCGVMRMDLEGPAVPATAAAPAMAAAPASMDCGDDSATTDLLGHGGKGSPRQQAISFVRRGRFLVQTYL